MFFVLPFYNVLDGICIDLIVVTWSEYCDTGSGFEPKWDCDIVVFPARSLTINTYKFNAYLYYWWSAMSKSLLSSHHRPFPGLSWFSTNGEWRSLWTSDRVHNIHLKSVLECLRCSHCNDHLDCHETHYDLCAIISFDGIIVLDPDLTKKNEQAPASLLPSQS